MGRRLLRHPAVVWTTACNIQHITYTQYEILLRSSIMHLPPVCPHPRTNPRLSSDCPYQCRTQCDCSRRRTAHPNGGEWRGGRNAARFRKEAAAGRRCVSEPLGGRPSAPALAGGSHRRQSTVLTGEPRVDGVASARQADKVLQLVKLGSVRIRNPNSNSLTDFN